MSYRLTGDWNQPQEQPTNRGIPTMRQSPDKNLSAELLWPAVRGILSCTDIRKTVHCDSTGRGPGKFYVYCFPTFYPASIFRLIFMFLSNEAQPWVSQLPARSVGLLVNYWNKGQPGEPSKQQLLSQVGGGLVHIAPLAPGLAGSCSGRCDSNRFLSSQLHSQRRQSPSPAPTWKESSAVRWG